MGRWVWCALVSCMVDSDVLDISGSGVRMSDAHLWL